VITNSSVSAKNKILITSVFILVLVLLVVEFGYLFSILIGMISGLAVGLTLGINALLSISLLASLCVVLFIIGIILMRMSQGGMRMLFYNLSLVFLAVMLFDFYFQYKLTTHPMFDVIKNLRIEEDLSFYTRHDYLGTLPKRNMKATVTSRYKDEVLYKVTYSVDSNGHRIVPRHRVKPDSKSVIFFGCSFTFGYGLEDNEAFPYMLAQKLNKDYEIYNFAFSGYGTHQMISALQHGNVDSIVKIKPTHVIYTAVTDHLNRIVYRKTWGSHDPHYEVEDGKLVYKGRFDEDLGVLSNYSRKFQQSPLLDAVFQKQREEKAIELFVSMVVTSKEEVLRRYPDCDFSVFVWDDPGLPSGIAMVEGLKKKGIKVILISSVLPGYIKDPGLYHIKPFIEPHPNLKANKYIADYLEKMILRDDEMFADL
jgi:hypothetical protein